jgi:hypothetical protein
VLKRQVGGIAAKRAFGCHESDSIWMYPIHSSETAQIKFSVFGVFGTWENASMESVTIFASVRPGRMAIFTDIDDPEWQSTALHILQMLANFWGGFGCLIVPTNGKEISPLFWQLLETYDPDYLHQYRRTGGDVQKAEPQKFQQWINQKEDQWKSNGNDLSPQIRKSIEEDVSRWPLSNFHVDADLQQQLKARLAPFFFEQYIVHAGWLSADSSAFHPHTSISEILPHTDHTKHVLQVEGESWLEKLWYSAAFGYFDHRAQKDLEGIGIKTTTIDAKAHRPQLIHTAVEGRVSGSLAGLWRDNLSTEVTEVPSRCPAALSLVQLARYQNIRAHARDWTEPTVAIAGNTLSDFCLYFCLSRLRSRVLWILPAMTDRALSGGKGEPNEEDLFHFATTLRSMTSYGQHGRGLQLISATLNDQQLDQILKSIEQTALGSKFEKTIIGGAVGDLIEFPERLYERNNASVPAVFQLPQNRTIALFQTPKPKHFEPVEPSKHRWITELRVQHNQLPRHPSLGTFVIGIRQTGTEGARISSVGPSYFCPTDFLLGTEDIDTALVRPDIQVPDLMDVLERVCLSAQLECSISDKGFYASDTLRKFGSLAEFGKFCRSGHGKALISKYLDSSANKPGVHTNGVLLSDGRRYLDFASLAVAVGKNDLAVKLTDYLGTIGLLHRGFIFQCKFCRNSDWFAVAEITESFTCKRCSRQQRYTREHWKHPDQPNWYFKLDEVCYQGFLHNMQVPMMALDFLRRNSKDTFLFTPELWFTKSGSVKPFIESDLNCIIDGTLTIGEAKSQDQLENTSVEEISTLKKYCELAELIGAREMVLATSCSSWSNSTKTNIGAVFANKPIQVRYLTSADLEQ